MSAKNMIIFVVMLLCGIFIVEIETVFAVGDIKFSPDKVELNEREMKSLDLVNKWVGSGVPPYISGGKLVYVHGSGGIPTVIASPMQVCDVELQPGEVINEIVVGDSARWIIAEGIADNTSHIFIKPVDSGLLSSAVITTDRRVYHLRLLSRKKEHIPYIGFAYTSDLRAVVAAENAKAARVKKWNTTKTEQGETDLSSLNFDYSVEVVKGSPTWKPLRVYNDSHKTYIRFPESAHNSELPALIVRKGKKDVLVNYRVKGMTMEVDGLFDTIALILGVDQDKEEVEVSRKSSRKNHRSRKIFGQKNK